MTSLASILPPPKHTPNVLPTPKWGAQMNRMDAHNSKVVEPPPYGQRDGYIPRDVGDYGDGGAFPEIHVTQYPLHMGDKEKGGDSQVIPLSVDAEGNIQYDAIIQNNRKSGEIVYSKYSDLLPKEMTDDQLLRPSAEEEVETAERTRKALGMIIDRQMAVANSNVPSTKAQAPVFVRYTPSQALGNDAYNSGAKQRIVRLQEKPVDPMEPAKFKHKRLPALRDETPVPVTRSPPRKATAADRANWKIPPCISNWKNIKGYTVSLDKRLASDGRGLQEVQVNSQFAKFSEALYHAEQAAREDIETRAAIQLDMARRKKLEKEEELRQLAAKARTEAHASTRDESSDDDEVVDERDDREQLRRDRRRTIRRDLRMENMGEERKKAMRARFSEERDVSEQIALGKQPKVSKDAMFDQRLFNQDQGISQGLGGDDSAYNIYDKPLFKGSSANQIYKPKANIDNEAYGGDEPANGNGVRSVLEKSTSKFKADRGFKGTESTTAASRGAGRDKPVLFEKEEQDPFGMGEFLTSAKRSNALDSIGSRGQMMASSGGGGGGGGGTDGYSRRHDSRKSREFRRAGDHDERESKRRRH